MNTPVTKKTLRRKHYGAQWFATIIVLGLGLYMFIDMLRWPDLNWDDVATVLMMQAMIGVPSWFIIWVLPWMRYIRVERDIKRQEQYLGVDFNQDMQGIHMRGGMGNDIEAVAYGDWYVLLSLDGNFVVNRNYITGVHSVYKKMEETKGGTQIWMMIELETVEHTLLKGKIGNCWQAVSDLCDWLGHPITGGET